MTDFEIIQLLGGPTAVARLLGIKPPSVHAWQADGIPEGRLRELAAEIERLSNGKFTRRDRWPEKYTFYWPELAKAPATIAQPAIELVADKPVNTVSAGALRSGEVRRHVERRVQDMPSTFDRRAHKGPPFQAIDSGAD